MSLKDEYLDADQEKLLKEIKRTCFDPLKKDVTDLKAGQETLKAGQESLESGQAELKKSLDNHLSSDHKTINEKLDKLIKTVKQSSGHQDK